MREAISADEPMEIYRAQGGISAIDRFIGEIQSMMAYGKEKQDEEDYGTKEE